MEKKIGFIGLGIMGAPMARNLRRKYHDVLIYDINTVKMQSLESEGFTITSGINEVGRSADVVILSLPNSQIVKDVILGGDGLTSTLPHGSIIIDTSTTEPTVTVEIAKTLKERALRFLDAPVSGGEKAAIEGTLSFMVGGDQSLFDECSELLQAMGTTIVRVGDNGMGQAAKMVNQMIVGATFAIAAESFALGVKAGLDPRVLYEAIRNGWAGSRVLDVAVPAMLERNFKPGGTVDIHWKDLGYALSLAKDKDVPTPITAMTHEVFKAARAGGKGHLSQPAVVMLWEKLLEIEIK